MPSFKVNENNIVIAVMSFPPCEADAQVLDSYDTSIIGKRYDSDSSTFHEVPQPHLDDANKPQE